MIILRVVIIIILGLIFWQDQKERMVYWFLYPLVGIIGFLIQINFLVQEMIVINSIINLILIITIITVLYIYSNFILKKKLIGESIGIGDILFFISLCFCFSIVSFLILFVFSLIFSLIFHFFKRKDNLETVPLAGYMSIFFAAIYLVTIFVNSDFLYTY